MLARVSNEQCGSRVCLIMLDYSLLLFYLKYNNTWRPCLRKTAPQADLNTLAPTTMNRARKGALAPVRHQLDRINLNI